MITSNINLGKDVFIEKTSSINNVSIGDKTKIAGHVKVFGSENNLLIIGKDCYIGMNSVLEGFNGKVTIGNHVSFA